MASDLPSQRDVWLADLDPTQGHEQAGQRPVVALSIDQLNQGPSGLAIVIPLTTTDRGSPLHVAIDPRGRATRALLALTEMVRSISTHRLLKRWGTIRPTTLTEIAHRVHLLTRPA